MKVSSVRGIPKFTRFWTSMIDLYTATNLARLEACVFVVLKISRERADQLQSKLLQQVCCH